MANFFIIDQSLRDASGHHCDYVRCVATATNASGYQTIIGAHRKLPHRISSKHRHAKHGLPDSAASLNSLGTVRRSFHNTVYQPDSYLAGLRYLTRSNLLIESKSASAANVRRGKRWRLRISQLQHHRRRERLIRAFAADCERFFRGTQFTNEDQVFLTTVSELELAGLACFLARRPNARQCQWHLQFHFNLFAGRPPEYDHQTKTFEAVQSCFKKSLSRMNFQHLNFYTTSEELAEQYNRLNVGQFQTLPYPVSPEFIPAKAAHSKPQTATSAIPIASPVNTTHASATNENQPAPIKITCPGGIRREKGHLNYLQPLVDKIWDPLLANGNVQLQLQRPKRKSLRNEKIELTFPTPSVAAQPPVVYFAHPLPRKKYVDLVRSTDIGLLFYDSHVYYSRRAGVLGELLSSGKPVIVPAGCWLAEQIQEPIFQHADSVLTQHAVRRAGLADFRWESRNVPMPGGVLSFDQHQHPFNFDIQLQTEESMIGLEFDWHWPNQKGTYCRIEMEQFDDRGLKSHCQRRVVGHRELSKKVVSLFTLEPETVSVRFSLKNAFHDSTALIKNVVAVMGSTAQSNSQIGKIPIGCVGAIAADQDHVGDCIGELLQHLSHYRETAERFSKQWFAQHDPQRTVQHLVDSIPASRVA